MMTEDNGLSKEQKAAKARLEAHVAEHGMSVKDFADTMEYSYPYAWTILRGKRVLTVEVIGRLVRGFGGDLAEEVCDILVGNAISRSGATHASPVQDGSDDV